ncbi:glycosyltransferase family 87 protein [Pirellulaceae bacterium SH449]
MNLSQIIRETRFFAVILLVLLVSYCLFAPNYRWSDSFDETPYAADFLQEWTGARLILSGEADELYSDRFVQSQHDKDVVGFAWNSAEYFPAVYPPPHYLLFSVFGLAPYQWAGVCWLVAQFAFVYVSWLAIRDVMAREASKAAREDMANSYASSLWMALILFPPLLFSITLGQKSTLWMMLIALSVYSVIRGKNFTGGIIFGMLSIKPTLFFLLPLVMLKQRRWGFVAGSFVSAAGIWGGAYLVMPASVWTGFLSVASTAGSFAENGGYRPEWSCNLMSLAYALPTGYVSWGKLAICAPLAIYLLFVAIFRSPRMDSPIGWLLVLVCTALLSPHFYYYDMCVLLGPLLWLWSRASREATIVYVALAVCCVVNGDVYRILGVPPMPIVLIGMVCAAGLEVAMKEGAGSRRGRHGRRDRKFPTDCATTKKIHGTATVDL